MKITECCRILHRMILPAAAIGPVAAGVLAGVLTVLPAEAHSPCDPTDNDRAEASRVLVGLTREIDVMEASIVEALRLQTGQLSGYAAQSAKAVTGALDAQTGLQAQIAREVEETRAMRARRPTGQRLRRDHRARRARSGEASGGKRLCAGGRRRDRAHRGRPRRGSRCRRRRRQCGPFPDRYRSLLQRRARR